MVDRENSDLIAAMSLARAACDEPSRSALLRTASAAKILIPIRRQTGSLEILIHTRESGHPIFVAFTDVATAQAWAQRDVEWGEIAVPDLCRRVLSNAGVRIVINPGPESCILERPDLEVLADSDTLALDALRTQGGSQLTVKGDHGIQLRIVPNAPGRIEETVRSTLLHSPEVKAAYLLEVEGGGSLHPGVGLVMAEGQDPEHVAAAIGRALRSVMTSSEYVDILPLNAEQARVAADTARSLI